MRDVLETLTRWIADDDRFVVATVASVERSAPRGPGATMAISERGEIAGSVTGGCVEPAVIAEATAILGGGPARVISFGIADDEAFGVGLPCGGTVEIVIASGQAEVVSSLRAAVADDRHVAVVTDLAGDTVGHSRLISLEETIGETGRRVALDDSGPVGEGEGRQLVAVYAPRPRMYVFGAIDFASALAKAGSFIGYRVTVCDARGTFVTPERFPTAEELVVEWPHELIARSHVDERTAICVLTHEERFDVPALKAALETSAGYIGAMGSKRTTARRTERLLAEGVDPAQLERIRAPIGLSLGGKAPEEVAIAIAAEIVQVRNHQRQLVKVAA
jgi:xanthine dehydrogenase accessory factor